MKNLFLKHSKIRYSNAFMQYVLRTKYFYILILFLFFHPNIINAQSQSCVSAGGNPSVYGVNQWIGYVYSTHTGSAPSNPFTTYRGYVTENENFYRDFQTGNPGCATSADYFAIRYRMNKVYPAGTYRITVSADDGVRLSVNGGVSWLINQWVDQGYTTYSAEVYLNGSTNLVLDYYEHTGGAALAFEIGLIAGAATGNYSYTACGMRFYDRAGPAGDYANNENYTVTFYPENSYDKVQLVFNSFVTESNGSCTATDLMNFYNGNSTSAPLILTSQSGCASRPAPTVITSTAADGSLTVQWVSNGATTAAGWHATVNCVTSTVYSGTLTTTPVTVCSPPNGTITVNPNLGSGGTTWFKDDFSSGTPQVGSYSLSGTPVAVRDAGSIRLTNTTNQNGYFIVNNPGFNTGFVELTCDIYVGDGNGADELYIDYGPLRIAFDSYYNGYEPCAAENTTGGAASVRLAYNGTDLQCYTNFALRNSWKSVILRINQSNQLTFIVGGVVIFKNVNLPAAYGAANKSTWNWTFYAWTGGAWDRYRVDNVHIIANNQYEYSLDNVNWQTSNVFTGLYVGTHTVYMRAKNPASNSPNPSNAIGSIYINNGAASVGNPAVFGTNQWNVYGYHGGGNALDGIYRGYYTQNYGTYLGFNSDTTNYFSNILNPSVATNWQGGCLGNDTFVFVHKREGFPCGSYRLSMRNWDDATVVYINGVLVWSCGDWKGGNNCLGAIPGIYELDANSRIEVRTTEWQGSAVATLHIEPVISAISANGDSRTCAVPANSGWSHFTSGNRIILSLQNNTNQNLGNVTATSYVQSSAITIQDCVQPTIAAFDRAAMGRRWRITSSNSFTNNVTLRLYYHSSDYTTLQAAANSNVNLVDDISSINDIKLTKYSGVNENGSFSDNNCTTGSFSLHSQVGNGLTSYFSGGVFVDFVVNSFSELWLHGSSVANSPLPVELMFFSGNCEDGLVTLDWATASEQNNAFFIIEKSIDGENWEFITRVSGAGNSNDFKQYNTTFYVDQKSSYYRLVQQDFDGKLTYEGIVSLNCKLDLNEYMEVFPNPASNEVSVTLNAQMDYSLATLNLMDVAGRIVLQKNISIQQGKQTFVTDVSNLKAGIYFIQIKAKEKVVDTQKLIVAH